MPPVLRIIQDVFEAALSQHAVVLVLDCGHRHVRPLSMNLFAGGNFSCCFCEAGDPHPVGTGPADDIVTFIKSE